jgi:hypothetical protein
LREDEDESRERDVASPASVDRSPEHDVSRTPPPRQTATDLRVRGMLEMNCMTDSSWL